MAKKPKQTRRQVEIKRHPDIILKGSSPWRLQWDAPEEAEPEWAIFERKLKCFLTMDGRIVDRNDGAHSVTFHVYGCTVRKYSDLREAEPRVKGRDHCEYVTGVEIYGSITFSKAVAQRILDIQPGYLRNVEKEK